jgi:hypothetical protein
MRCRSCPSDVPEDLIKNGRCLSCRRDSARYTTVKNWRADEQRRKARQKEIGHLGKGIPREQLREHLKKVWREALTSEEKVTKLGPSPLKKLP